MDTKHVTIREVAERAGVSISSVSRYLSDPQSIQPLAAYNIKNAIKELHYVPNVFARNLKRGRSDTIGLIVPHTKSFFDTVTSVIGDYFYVRGFSTFICKSDNEGEKERFYLQRLLDQKAAGIIIAPSGQNTMYLRDVVRGYQNLVVIDRYEDVGCDIVLENHRQNAYTLMTYLLKNCACDRILLLFGRRDSYNTLECQAGTEQALREAGRQDDRQIIRSNAYVRPDVVKDAVRELLSAAAPTERPLVVAFGTDLLEYTVVCINQTYPEWMKHIDIGGFALEGTAEKLRLSRCPLIIKAPEAVGIAAAECLYKKIQEPDKTEAPQVIAIKVRTNF